MLFSKKKLAIFFEKKKHLNPQKFKNFDIKTNVNIKPKKNKMSDPNPKAISFQTFSKDLLSDPQSKPSPEEELLKIKHEVEKL